MKINIVVPLRQILLKLAGVLILFCAMPAFALQPTQIYEMNKNKVGLIKTQGSRGSGVVIDNELVLTNCHVIAGQSNIEYLQGSRSFPATLVAGNAALDLCKIRVPGLSSEPVKIRDRSNIRVGERVYAIGNPRGYELTISEGLVSGLRDIEDTVMIQTTAPISPGSSGGGLFDTSGRLIGITTESRVDSQNINFAMPATLARQLKKMTFVEAFNDSTINITPKLLDKLMDLYERQDIESILNITRKWIEKDGESAYAWTLSGLSLSYIDEFKKSEDALLKAIEINPAFTPALFGFAIAQLRAGDVAKKSEYLKKCTAVSSVTNSLIGSYQALCKAMSGDKGSVEQVNAYIEENPSRSWLYFIRATIFNFLKRYAEAKDSADLAIEKNPNSALAYAQAAISLMAMGRSAEAKPYIDKALAISPRSPSMIETATVIAFAMNKREEAAGYFSQLKTISPNRARLLRDRLARTAK